MRVGGVSPSRNWVLGAGVVNLVGVCVGGRGRQGPCFCIGKWACGFCFSARRNPACAKCRVIASFKSFRRTTIVYTVIYNEIV